MFERIKEIIEEQLGLSLDHIDEDSSLADDLDADSLDIVEILMAIEEEFEIEDIPDEEIEKMKTIGDLMDYIKSQKGEN